MAMTVAEQLMYTTTKVTSLLNGVETGSGTAFYYNIKVPNTDGNSIPALITNKHVIAGSDEIAFRAHIRGASREPSGAWHNCRIATADSNVVYHPDPNVDLCAISIHSILSESDRLGKPIFNIAIDESLIPSASEWPQFDALENLLMIGCPRGIYDEVNNIPIFRRGYSATPLSRNYEGNSSFLVDMACYPGSSGSPIFIYDPNGFLDKTSNSYMMSQRVKFVGILFRGPLIDSKGQIIFQNIPTVNVQNMMHLGEAIKATEVLTISNMILKMMGVST